MNHNYFFIQDTSSQALPDTSAVPLRTEDSSIARKRFSVSEADDIFRAMERRERELDSIARVRAYRAYMLSLEKQEAKGFDTAAVPYNLESDSAMRSLNPLSDLSVSYYSPRDTSEPVFHETVDTSRLETGTAVPITKGQTRGATHDLRPDWLLGIIIASLVLLAWLKLFYNKFLDQTLQSLGNYQLSTKLLRDQSIFSRRVSFLLNVNFILVLAAQLYLVFGYFGIRPFRTGDFLSYLAYAGLLSGLVLLRYATSHILGFVFMKQAEFREYLHQLLLIYKNLGVYLLFLVAGIAYIREDLRVYLVWISVLVLVASYVLRFLKGRKIVNRGGVLIFYLILYLCTLEILPLLVFYRFFSLSVLTG